MYSIWKLFSVKKNFKHRRRSQEVFCFLFIFNCPRLWNYKPTVSWYRIMNCVNTEPQYQLPPSSSSPVSHHLVTIKATEVSFKVEKFTALLLQVLYFKNKIIEILRAHLSRSHSKCVANLEGAQGSWLLV